jgi:hypothetical protein
MRVLHEKFASELARPSGQRTPRMIAGSPEEEPSYLNSPAGKQNVPNSETFRLARRQVHDFKALNRSQFRVEVNVRHPNVHRQKLVRVVINLPEIGGLSQPYGRRAQSELVGRQIGEGSPPISVSFSEKLPSDIAQAQPSGCIGNV